MKTGFYLGKAVGAWAQLRQENVSYRAFQPSADAQKALRPNDSQTSGPGS